MNKRVSLLFLCCAFFIAAFLVLNEWRFEKLSSVKKMQQLWEDDLQLMEDNHQLPKGWSSIREIKMSPGSPEALDWLKRLQVPIVVNKGGDFELQILFLPWTEDGKEGVFLQYDLVDLKSSNSNTVFETNRTIMLSGQGNWMAEMLESWIGGQPQPPPADGEAKEVKPESPKAAAAPSPSPSPNSSQPPPQTPPSTLPVPSK